MFAERVTEQLAVDCTCAMQSPLAPLSESNYSAWGSDHCKALVGLEPGMVMSDRPMELRNRRPLHATVNVLAWYSEGNFQIENVNFRK